MFEIGLHGKPAIVIPIPEEVSHDQRSNAYAYAQGDRAVVIEEKNLSDSLLLSEIDRIMQDTILYTHMSESAKAFSKPDASVKIAEHIIQISQQH